MLIYGCMQDGGFQFGLKKHCEISRMAQVEQPHCAVVATSDECVRVSSPVLHCVYAAFVVCLDLTYYGLLFDVVNAHDTIAASRN